MPLTFFPCDISTGFRIVVSLTGLRDHNQDAPHSVGLLWTSDEPDTETSN